MCRPATRGRSTKTTGRLTDGLFCPVTPELGALLPPFGFDAGTPNATLGPTVTDALLFLRFGSGSVSETDAVAVSCTPAGT